MRATAFDVDAIAAGEPRVMAFPAGTAIYRAGDPGDCAYIIKDGQVELRQKRGPVEVLDPGEIFGEMALLDGGGRTATAVAVDAVAVIPISCALFVSLIRNDEEFVMALLRLMARRHRATIALFQRCLEQTTPAHAAPAVAGAIAPGR
jgi:CRP/FNR family transcriptional regulator, cyclic AMP receptor protein